MSLEPLRFSIHLEGDKETQEAMIARAGAIAKNLHRAGQRIGRMVVGDIRSHFGGAGMVGRRSGWLSNAIGFSVKRRRWGTRIEVGVRGDIPYAAIHEFGRKTKPHIIRPKRHRLLRWQADASGPAPLAEASAGLLRRRNIQRGARQAGSESFAPIVHHPGSRVPARPFLGPGLLRNRNIILQTFWDAFQAGLKGEATL